MIHCFDFLYVFCWHKTQAHEQSLHVFSVKKDQYTVWYNQVLYKRMAFHLNAFCSDVLLCQMHLKMPLSTQDIHSYKAFHLYEIEGESSDFPIENTLWNKL